MLAKMQVNQIRKTNLKGKSVYLFLSVVAGVGLSKTVHGVLRASNYNPIEYIIYREQQLSSHMWSYDDFDLYMRATEKIYETRKKIPFRQLQLWC